MTTETVQHDLELRSLKVSFDGRVVLDVDHLEIHAGEAMAILGSNGSGKSTLLRAIVGITPCSVDELRCGPMQIARWGPHTRANRLGFGYLDQSRGVVREFTVRENLMVVTQRRGVRAADAQSAFDELVAELEPSCPGLGERWDHVVSRSRVLAGDLSGGEQRILALLMVLVRRPRIVFMDEPLAGVSPVVRELFLAIWRELAQRGATVVVVEQNVAEIVRVMPRAIVLRSGLVRYDGTTEQLHDARTMLELL